MPKADEPRDKVREQIEEILELDEKRAPVQSGRIQVARPISPRKVRSGTPLWYPTGEKLILAGLALLLIAVVTRRAVLPLALGGFVLAGIGYYMLVTKRRRARLGGSSGGSGAVPPQYWRGKPVKPSESRAPRKPVKKRDGNVLEFPDSRQSKSRRWFGKKK